MKHPFVLVHGAWHGGWCWKRVVPLLRGAGYRVTRPTLTGLGERVHLASPAVTLDTHIEDVVRHVEAEDLERVVLVGHSYGGMVITGVADRLPARLAALVYLDAFVPEDGKSILDYVAPERRSSIVREGESTGTVSCLPLAQLGLLRPEDVQWVERHITRQPYGTMAEPIRLERQRDSALPRTYVYCSAPPTGTFDAFAAEFSQDPSWRYVELKAGHDAMITDPRSVANILVEAAGALPDVGCAPG